MTHGYIRKERKTVNNIMQSPIRHKRRHRHKRRQRQDTGEDTDTREPHRQDKTQTQEKKARNIFKSPINSCIRKERKN